MLILPLAVVAVAAVTAVLLSPGKPRAFVDASGAVVPGSISEKVFVEVNGTQQGMFIRGRSSTAPVLLYLHGGIPDYFLTAKYPTGLDEEFVVVWWEQRGVGLSHAAADASSPITVELMLSDVLAVTDYLRHRFRQDRIYLMGRSGGTFLGMQAIQRAPERYHAYIAVAQVTNQLESERQAYAYMLQRFREAGDAKWVRRLEATSVGNGTPPEYLKLRDPAMHQLGIGTMKDMKSIVAGLFLPSLLFREYTVREKWNLWAAKARYGVSTMWEPVLATDMRRLVPEVQVPVYFLHGVHDYTCSYSLARDYAARLRAPVKGFYTFHESAHSPIFEEPARVMEIIRADVLRGAATAADRLLEPDSTGVIVAH